MIKNKGERASAPHGSTHDALAQKTMPAKPYRILVADDHAVVRRGLRALLGSQLGVEVCWEASTGVEAMEHVKREKPDLVVLDLTMPEMNGLEVVQAVREQSPATEILVLTVHFSEELAREVLRSGALGYVLKSDADAELLAAVDHARHHQPFFTSQLAASMVQKFVHSPADRSRKSREHGTPPDLALTPRETDVVQLLAEGKGNKQVAAALGVSTRTIESHRKHIMRKMNFGSFSDMVRFAIRNNLVAS